MYQDQARKFITIEIAMGLTFATDAATQSVRGKLQRGQRAKAKAVRACAEAERQMREAAARGWNVHDLWAGLQELYVAIEGLDRDERKAA
jgi:hypothetical protein